jgi:hypothetical protein
MVTRRFTLSLKTANACYMCCDLFKKLGPVFGFLLLFFVSTFFQNAFAGSVAFPGSRMIVLAGGFGSCALAGSPSELNLWEPLNQILLKENEPVPTFVMRICFAIGQSTIFFDVLEQKPERSHRISSGSGSVDHALKFLEAFISLRVPDGLNEFILIGQSHGGDLVMKLASQFYHRSGLFSGEPQKFSRTLITVDPVSLDRCHPIDFLTGLFFKLPGCIEFPRKSEYELHAIRSFANRWFHFYQTNFSKLHSGSQTMANTNVELHYRAGFKGFMGAHLKTETDPRVWSFVSRYLHALPSAQ